MAPKSIYAKDDSRALMAKAIMRPLKDGSIASEWVDGSPMDNFADSFIKPGKKMTSLERLEIYNQQYWYRLLDSLRDDFPGLLAVLGNDRFEELSKAYLTSYPSRSFTLRNLGECLEKFVEDDNEFFGRQEKKLIMDVVSFEWAEIQAFDLEKKAILDWEKYSNLAEMDPRLELQPYVFILSLNYAVDDFLLKRKKSADSRTVVTARATGCTHENAQISKPKKQKINVVIHRHNNSVFYKRINAVEYQVLTAIKAGASLTEALSEIRAKDLKLIYGDPSGGISSLGVSFANWTKLGWFCAIKG